MRIGANGLLKRDIGVSCQRAGCHDFHCRILGQRECRVRRLLRGCCRNRGGKNPVIRVHAGGSGENQHISTGQTCTQSRRKRSNRRKLRGGGFNQNLMLVRNSLHHGGTEYLLGTSLKSTDRRLGNLRVLHGQRNGLGQQSTSGTLNLVGVDGRIHAGCGWDT